MSPDLMFWLALLTKMAVSAAFVVTVAMVAERVGSVIGGLVAALPISTGPAYVFLALDHDAAFIAQSALASLVVNAGTMTFALSYILLAQTRGTILSLSIALVVWFATTAATRQIEWSLIGVLTLNVGAYLVCLTVARRFGSAQLRPTAARWYDVPLRAGLVAALVITVVIVSRHLGPSAAGTLAVFPVVFSSLIMIFQPRIGGRATAALIANTISGLIGFAAALLVVHLTAVPLGTPAALALALSTAIGWNLMLWSAWRYRR